MLIGLLTVLSALIGGFLFRVRGGALPTGSTTIARLIWSVGMAALAVALSYAGGVWAMNWWLLTLVPAFFLGCLCPWWNSIDMGRNEGTFWKDFLVMMGRGVLWVLFAAAGLGLLGYSAMYVFAGLLCPVCYTIGWRLPNTKWIKQGTEYGEILFGMVCGAGLALSILL